MLVGSAGAASFSSSPCSRRNAPNASGQVTQAKDRGPRPHRESQQLGLAKGYSAGFLLRPNILSTWDFISGSRVSMSAELP
jgi:hypothetical protein